MPTATSLTVTLEKEQTNLAAFKMTVQDAKETYTRISNLSLAIAQNELKGEHNAFAEQHILDLKNLNGALHEQMTRLAVLALYERSLIALFQYPCDQSLLVEYDELSTSLSEYFTHCKSLDITCDALLDQIRATPVSSPDVLECQL